MNELRMAPAHKQPYLHEGKIVSNFGQKLTMTKFGFTLAGHTYGFLPLQKQDSLESLMIAVSPLDETLTEPEWYIRPDAKCRPLNRIYSDNPVINFLERGVYGDEVPLLIRKNPLENIPTIQIPSTRGFKRTGLGLYIKEGNIAEQIKVRCYERNPTITEQVFSPIPEPVYAK
ncbi:MAG: hypothetical protein ACMXYK_03910 [Candidatus Woesearchaeota archaeon]